MSLQVPGLSATDLVSDEWWRGAVLYQVYPRSYLDTNGDGIGDLPGIIQRLDYIAGLGVDGIWLSPFYASPMADFGYDVSDFCAVDPIFGTMVDFDALVARAHALGLRVIIDQVYCHTSDQHAWFQESRADRCNPKADWYVWADCKPDGSPPSNWQSVFGGPAWTWDARRSQYYLHNFLAAQPALNVHNLEVQNALLATARFWLDRGVDGFRLDAINFLMHHPTLQDNPPVKNPTKMTRPFDFQHQLYNKSHPDIPKFLARIRALTKSYGDSRFTVAEVVGELAAEEMKLYTSGDQFLHSGYGFEFLYADQMSADLVRTTMEAWTGAPNEGWPSWTFSNHDAPRAISRWSPPDQRPAAASLYLFMLLCLRGNVFIYQGEELGLPHADLALEELRDPEAIANWPQTLGRDGARTPMPWRSDQVNGGFSRGQPWLPVPVEHLPLAVDRQEADPDSTLNLCRRLLLFRRRELALCLGAQTSVDVPSPLIGFERTLGDRVLLCIFNPSLAAITLTRLGWRVIEAVGGADIELLPPLSGLVAERRDFER
ncbi:MAG: alpha-glucosidase [Phenylobacterium zucineum]|nr:MAG: alpha-glucosidase [Phenylobacterium zucineum]